jgi:hypothetical protein
MCAQRPARGHPARGYGEAGGQPRRKRKAARVKAERTTQRRCLGRRNGAGGGDPSESESLGEDEGYEAEEEGEIIFLRAPTPKNLPSHGDIFGRPMGALASAHRAKRPRADAGGASSLPSQPALTLVCSVLLETRSCVAGAWMTFLLSAL